jgi:choline dehydrogenase
MASRSVYFLVLLVVLSIAMVDAGKKGGNQPPCGIRAKPVPTYVDYIVMGGGLAGSVVAGRLSANPANTVLLIEAGFDASDDAFTQDPTNWATIAGSPLDWRDLVALGEPVVFQDLQKRHITSGRTLGGSSAINSAMYIRSPETFDRWASKYGLTDWSYDSVLELFKSIENSDRAAPGQNPQYHGSNGPHRITGQIGIWHPKIVQAAADAGISYNPDWNGAKQLTDPDGVIGFQERTEIGGIRQNAYKSFVKPHLCRANLYVMDKSYALKVNFDAQKRARSVTWQDNLAGKTYTTKALKEIVMSMGTVRTSQILRLSGVGNATELQNLGVPLVHNLPGVGRNLQDHPITKINIRSNTTCVADRLKEGHIFLRTPLQDPNDPRPDVQAIGITDCPNIFTLIYVLTPRSRGWVELYSNDPTHKAGVRINFFADQRDLDTLIAGTRQVFNIYKNSPLFNSTQATFTNIDDDEEVKKFIIGTPFVRSDTNSGMHLVGTCKMGPASDPMAVVDSRLRVYGVSRLRIADASVMPDIPSANTQAATYLIGAKAAEMIEQDN